MIPGRIDAGFWRYLFLKGIYMFNNTGSLASQGRTLVMNQGGIGGPTVPDGNKDVVILNGCQGGGRIMYQNANGALSELGGGGGGGGGGDVYLAGSAQGDAPQTFTGPLNTFNQDVVVGQKLTAEGDFEVGPTNNPTTTINAAGQLSAAQVTATGDVTGGTIVATNGVESIQLQGGSGNVAASGGFSAQGGNYVAIAGNFSANAGDVECGGNVRAGAAAATQSILLNGLTADITIGLANAGVGPGTGKLETEKIDIGLVGASADTEIFSDAGGGGTRLRMTAGKDINVLDSASQQVFGVNQTSAVFPSFPLYLPQSINFRPEVYEMTAASVEINGGQNINGGVSLPQRNNSLLFSIGPAVGAQWVPVSGGGAVALPFGRYRLSGTMTGASTPTPPNPSQISDFGFVFSDLIYSANPSVANTNLNIFHEIDYNYSAIAMNGNPQVPGLAEMKITRQASVINAWSFYLNFYGFAPVAGDTMSISLRLVRLM